MKAKKHIAIIGGGFAGLNLAKRLFNNAYYEVTLIDKNNYNYFTPLLYQVATSFLEPSSISYPFRKIFRNKGIHFRMAALERVDTFEKKLFLSDGEILDYDILVFAAGTSTNFFRNESIRKNAFSLKGIDDALFMRNELIKVLEKAALEKNRFERQKLLTIVVAGGGPTGVELAGMLAEMRQYMLNKDYPEISEEEVNIHIVDGAPVLLAPMSAKTHRAAYQALSKLGVHVRLGVQVTSFENDVVSLSDGTTIQARTMIWAAGVVANTFKGIPADALGRGNRMITDQFSRVKGLEDVFAIGDIGIQFTDEAYPGGHPQLAQPAIQQGTFLAKNLLRMARGKELKPFKYFDRGDMAIIGKNMAVADLFKHKLHLGGFLGLLSWLFIHLISLVNYNNMVKTLYNWTIAYLTNDQVLRMIFRSENREVEEKVEADAHNA